MKTSRTIVSILAVMATLSGWSQPASDFTPPGAGAVLSDKRDLISVDFPNEEVRTIIRNVAELFELNVVIPDTLVGRTSIKLRDVTWRQIFEEVLTPLNFTYTERANIIRIVSRDSLLAEPTMTDVFILNYARANEILPTVSPLVDTSEQVRGRIQVDQRNNALVVTERPSRMNQIREIIEKLDVATAQVMIETKFIEVTNDNGKDIGINWTSLRGYRIGTTGPVNSRVASLAGVDQQTGIATYTEDAISRNVGNTLNTLFNAPTITSATFSAAEFGLLISALESTENVRLVSNPTVVTLNNVEATINIGEEYPIPNYTYNQERGNFEISGFTYKPIGVILKVTPQVNNAGFIKLQVEPTVSSRSGTVNFGGASGAEIPIVTSRNTKTQVSLKDGFTLGIGGLIESTSSRGSSRVPVLGEIPIIGAAFKSRSESVRTRNLIVFITARSLDSETPRVEEIFNADAIRELQLRRSDLPGFRSSAPAFVTDEVPLGTGY